MAGNSQDSHQHRLASVERSLVSQDQTQETDPGGDSSNSETIETVLENIASEIDQLLKLSSAIRSSGLKNHDLRAAAFIDWDRDDPDHPFSRTEQFFNFVDNLLERRYDWKEKVYLKTRLTKAIAERRNEFSYRQNHQKKLSSYGSSFGRIGRVLAKSTEERPRFPEKTDEQQGVGLNVVTRPDGFAERKEKTLYAPGATTTASTFRQELFQHTSKSSITSGSTRGSHAVYQDDTIPPPPRLGPRECHFQCPYCCILLPRSTLRPSAWRYVTFPKKDFSYR